MRDRIRKQLDIGLDCGLTLEALHAKMTRLPSIMHKLAKLIRTRRAKLASHWNRSIQRFPRNRLCLCFPSFPYSSCILNRFRQRRVEHRFPLFSCHRSLGTGSESAGARFGIHSNVEVIVIIEVHGGAGSGEGGSCCCCCCTSLSRWRDKVSIGIFVTELTGWVGANWKFTEDSRDSSRIACRIEGEYM